MTEEKNEKHFITFSRIIDDVEYKSYFDIKDGKWQFWGDIPIDESAKLLFEGISQYLPSYTEDLKERLDKENEKIHTQR